MCDLMLCISKGRKRSIESREIGSRRIKTKLFRQWTLDVYNIYFFGCGYWGRFTACGAVRSSDWSGVLSILSRTPLRSIIRWLPAIWMANAWSLQRIRPKQSPAGEHSRLFRTSMKSFLQWSHRRRKIKSYAGAPIIRSFWNTSV